MKQGVLVTVVILVMAGALAAGYLLSGGTAGPAGDAAATPGGDMSALSGGAGGTAVPAPAAAGGTSGGPANGRAPSPGAAGASAGNGASAGPGGRSGAAGGRAAGGRAAGGGNRPPPPPAPRSLPASALNPDRQPAPRVEVPTAPLPPLSAETLAGSQWVVNGKVVDLQPDGAVVADGEAAGSWSVEGDRFRVEAGGVTTTGTIHGQDIQPDEGSEISRLN